MLDVLIIVLAACGGAVVGFVAFAVLSINDRPGRQAPPTVQPRTVRESVPEFIAPEGRPSMVNGEIIK